VYFHGKNTIEATKKEKYVMDEQRKFSISQIKGKKVVHKDKNYDLNTCLKFTIKLVVCDILIFCENKTFTFLLKNLHLKTFFSLRLSRKHFKKKMENNTINGTELKRSIVYTNYEGLNCKRFSAERKYGWIIVSTFAVAKKNNCNKG